MLNDFSTVYGAELLRRIRSRPFLIGMIVGIVAIGALTALPRWLENVTIGATNHVVLVANPPLARHAATLLGKDFTVVAVVPPQIPDARLLSEHRASAAVVLSRQGSALHASVYAKDPGNVAINTLRRDLVPLELELATSIPYARINALLTLPIDVHPVSSRFESSAESDAAHAIGFTLIFLLYILILVNSQLVMSSVAEEKTSRIAELLVASVDPIALLAGKIGAAATLALLQMVVWIATAIFLTIASAPSPAGGSSFDLAGLLTGDVVSPGMLVTFVLFFVLGFLQLSTLFAALASLINRTEELGSVTVPLIMPVVFALFIAIAALNVPDAPWVVGLSFVPVLSPFVMFARITVSEVPWWQVGLALAINAVALVLIAIAAGKIYRVGMLLYGRSPKLAQIWSVIRT